MNDKAIITEAAQRYGVRPDILWGLYGTETSFGKNVSTSSAGAVGPFQFEPATAKGMGVNPYNFRSAAEGAARYLAQYKSRGVGGMLSAYNAGPAGGYQSGYVNTTLQNAKTYGIPSASVSSRSAGIGQVPAAKEAPETVPLPKLAPLNVIHLPGPGLSAPEPAQKTPSAPPAAAVPGKLGGFIPANAELQINRTDMGQDIKTNPGGPIIAPGNGEVVAIKSDPSGFGPDYPVVKFTSGPLAGQSWYLGHTHSALKAGQTFRAGEVLSHTGTNGVGNATVPGWAEIGKAEALGTGNMNAGQATIPYLRKR
jgi:hypothetical protein